MLNFRCSLCFCRNIILKKKKKKKKIRSKELVIILSDYEAWRLSLTLSLSCRITEPTYRYKMRAVIAVAIFNRWFNDYTLNDSRYLLVNLVDSR